MLGDRKVRLSLGSYMAYYLMLQRLKIGKFMEAHKARTAPKARRGELRDRAMDRVSRAENALKSKAVTKEYLIGLLGSEAFSSRFKDTLDKVKKSNMEFGFSNLSLNPKRERHK